MAAFSCNQTEATEPDNWLVSDARREAGDASLTCTQCLYLRGIGTDSELALIIHHNSH